MKKKTLKAMLDDFMKTRSKCDGSGWAPVAEDDIEKLGKIILRILEEKYERDCDGSIPVEFDLVDRTRFERMHYFKIPYEHKAKTNDERMRILSLLNSNVHNAARALDQHVRTLDIIRRDEEEKRKDDIA